MAYKSETLIAIAASMIGDFYRQAENMEELQLRDIATKTALDRLYYSKWQEFKALGKVDEE